MRLKFRHIFWKWNRFPETKPNKDDWYLCTIAFPVDDAHIHSYVMALYYFTETGKFKNNLRQNVFDLYHVKDFEGTYMHTDRLCDRTNHVIAWMELPDKYYLPNEEVKEFIEKDKANG